MVYRIEIGLKNDVPDAIGTSTIFNAKQSFGLKINNCNVRDVYKINANITKDQAEIIKKLFSDNVIAESELGRLPFNSSFDWCIEVSFKPGVTDNLGRTARGSLEDILQRDLSWDEQVYTSSQYFISGDLNKIEVEKLSYDLLANRLIQNVSILNEQEWRNSKIDLEIPIFKDQFIERVNTIELPDCDSSLQKISDDGILSLSLEEMRAIRNHYLNDEVKAYRKSLDLPMWPTDIELECIAQTWSEHCSHKIFAGTINYRDEEMNHNEIIHSLYKTYIKASTKKIQESTDWLVSVFTDNAGIVKFDDKNHLVYKVETHNSPSALDPYGGAMTGIVGVNRDPLGTGMGSSLVSNVWGYCLASPFYSAEIPDGLMHPKRIRDGVHQGVIDGGNQSGIPYSRGFEFFDERFLGKPLVYCGTLGKIPVTITNGPSERKEIKVGDWVVMCGGRIGKDGIHGATFSSEELRKESPAQAVQIGDPLTQRKLYEFIIEARDLGLFRCITDNGAGGISCSFGEMGKYSGGCECELSEAPLKYEGMQPWEILISEAQERMTLAVQPEKKIDFEQLAKKRDVEVSFMGKFNDSGYFTIRNKQKIIASIDMKFLYEDGCPTMVMPAVWSKPNIPEPSLPNAINYEEIVISLIGSLNICSREYKSRMYDSEVKGLSVVKPFVGKESDVPSDASVMRIDYQSNRGAILSEGINPWFSDLDTYKMTASVIDEAIRKIVAVGGDLNRIAILDNFCWPDPVESEKTPDGAYKLAQLVRSCKALYDYTTLYQTPAVSGKDSCKNDSTRGGKKISIPPTLLISAIGQINEVQKSITSPFKTEGDLIYLIGETKNELGGSAFYRFLAEEQKFPQAYGGIVPEVDGKKALEIYRAMNVATDLQLFNSSTSPVKGGIAISMALAAIGGNFGADINLSKIHSDLTTALFSESNSRFIVTLSSKNKNKFLKVFENIEVYEVGVVNKTNVINFQNFSINLRKLRQAFKETLYKI